MRDDWCHVMPIAATFYGVPPGASKRALVEDGAVGTEESPPRSLKVVPADVEDLAVGLHIGVVT